MTTISEETQSPKDRRPATLGVSTYDQVSGLLIAVLAALAAVVALTFIVWWSSRIYLPRPTMPPVAIQDVGGGTGPSGGSRDGNGDQEFVEPAANEIPPAVEPRLEESLQEAISLAAAQQEMPELDLRETKLPRGAKVGEGHSGPRGPVDREGSPDGIPAWGRWEVRFDAPTVAEYSRQLDFFQIELGIVGGGSRVVTYVNTVSAEKPTVRTGDPKDEKRLRFTHRDNELREADRQLVQKAGVDPSGKIVCQFYSQQMYDKLLLLENIHKGPSRRITQVRLTTFGIRQVGDQYELFVVSQEYR